MKIGINQPYLFPYLGYFQLINAVDKFVIHDDVQFIKGGWINRNRILVNGQPKLFTFSVKGDHSKLNINERFFSAQYEKDRQKFMRILKHAYSHAPYFKQVYNLLDKVLSTSEKNISIMTTTSLREVCDYLGVTTPFVISSQIKKDNSLKGEARVIEINKRLNSTQYINPGGGTSLYSTETFAKHGLRLSFIKTRDVKYPQLGNTFIPNLSIVDVLMFNSRRSANDLLREYDLI